MLERALTASNMPVMVSRLLCHPISVTQFHISCWQRGSDMPRMQYLYGERGHVLLTGQQAADATLAEPC